MSATGVILQQFYYFFASGFVINMFIVANIIVWGNKKTIDEALSLLQSSSVLAVLIFVISAIIISIIIVGFNELCFQYYNKIKDRSKLRSSILYKLLVKGTISEASKKINDDKPSDISKLMEKFMKDSESMNVSIFKENSYYAGYICAKIIEQKENNSDVYKFRDCAYLIQYLTTAFAFILLCSIVMLAIIWIFCLGNKCVFTFYIANILISLIFLFFLPKIAGSFSERYLRIVGKAYMAQKMKALIPLC